MIRVRTRKRWLRQYWPVVALSALIAIGALLDGALFRVLSEGRGARQAAATRPPEIRLAAETTPETATSTAFTPTPIVPTSLWTPPFGVQMIGALNPGTGITYAVDMGASWVRVPVSWVSAEPTDATPAQYDWTSADSSIVDAAQVGLHLIVTVGDAPGWAATYANGPIDKAGLGEFAEFVGALVERYDGDGLNDAPGSPVVNDWEFYNEPDNGDQSRATWGNSYWGHDGAKYAEMLGAVYPAVKAANPYARVVFGGIACDWFEDQGGPFVREFLDMCWRQEAGSTLT